MIQYFTKQNMTSAVLVVLYSVVFIILVQLARHMHAKLGKEKNYKKLRRKGGK